jgi:hypothetical protein
MVVFFPKAALKPHTPMLTHRVIHARFFNMRPHVLCLSTLARISVYMRAVNLQFRNTPSCSRLPRM